MLSRPNKPDFRTEIKQTDETGNKARSTHSCSVLDLVTQDLHDEYNAETLKLHFSVTELPERY